MDCGNFSPLQVNLHSPDTDGLSSGFLPLASAKTKDAMTHAATPDMLITEFLWLILWALTNQFSPTAVTRWLAAQIRAISFTEAIFLRRWVSFTGCQTLDISSTSGQQPIQHVSVCEHKRCQYLTLLDYFTHNTFKGPVACGYAITLASAFKNKLQSDWWAKVLILQKKGDFDIFFCICNMADFLQVDPFLM